MLRSFRKQFALRIPLIGVLAILVVATLRGGAAEEPPDRKIHHLIEDLGSDRYETREAAAKALSELEEAISLLQEARKSADPEIRSRVRDILRALAWKRAQQGLARAKVLGKAGRIVEAADRVAYWGQMDNSGEGWDILMRRAEQLVESWAPYCSPGSFRRNTALPRGAYRPFAEKVRLKELAAEMIDINAGGEELILKGEPQAVHKLRAETGGSLLLRGEEIDLRNDKENLLATLHSGIIAASGDVRAFNAAYSLIIVGGNLEMNGVRGSIVVCDGDINLRAGAESSLIIARGKVTCGSGKPAFCMIRNEHSLLVPNSMWPHGKTIELKDGTPDPLAFVKFFELLDVGLTAEDFRRQGKADPDGVILKDVRRESPFVSGLRGGDMIRAIDGRKTPTTEILRRVLRQRLAKGGPTITFTVQRAGKTLDVSIPVKD